LQKLHIVVEVQVLQFDGQDKHAPDFNKYPELHIVQDTTVLIFRQD
jgi:hypothetical protein